MVVGNKGAFGELVWLVGREAIEMAERLDGLGVEWCLAHYTTPTEEAADAVSIDKAKEVARDDASLVYLVMNWRSLGVIAAHDDGGSVADRIDAMTDDDNLCLRFEEVLDAAALNYEAFETATNELRAGYTADHPGIQNPPALKPYQANALDATRLATKVKVMPW